MRTMVAVISLGVLSALLIVALTLTWDLMTQRLLLWSLWFFWVMGGFVTILWTTHHQMMLWHQAYLDAECMIRRLLAEQAERDPR